MDAFQAQYGYPQDGAPNSAPGPTGPTPPGANPYQSSLGQLSPDQLRALMKLGVLDEKGGILKDQMAMAQALRKPSQPHQTALGGALGAAGDMVNAYRSGRMMDQIGQQQQGLLDEKTAGREKFAQLWGF